MYRNNVICVVLQPCKEYELKLCDSAGGARQVYLSAAYANKLSTC